ADMQAHTQERKAGGIEPPGEFVDRGRTGRNPACRADHPIGDATDAVMGRPFRWWPLDRLGGDDRTAFDNQGFAGRLVVHRLPSWSANLGPVKRWPAIRAEDRVSSPMSAFGTSGHHHTLNQRPLFGGKR